MESYAQEQEEQEQHKPFDLPLRTKAGIIAVPGLPLAGIELLAHGGATPVALTGFALALLAAKSPWLIEKAGGNERILRAVAERPDLCAKLDALSNGHFSQQIAKLRQARPDLFSSLEPKEAYETVETAHTGEFEMEPLQPKAPADLPIFPPYPANKTIRLGRVVATGQRFDPHVNQFLGDGGVIAGQPGAGKSNLLGLMATGAANCGLSTIVLDYKREFYTLQEVVPTFLRAGHASFASEAGEHYYILTGETAADLADIIMRYGFLAVIDVPSYAGRPNNLAEAITALLNALMDRAQAQEERNRLPCLILVDEAHNFWPEERKLSAFSTMDKANFDALQAAYNRIVTGGRSYGFTMIVATQRIANIAKWAIAPLQIKVIMRHREQNDLKRCKEDAGEADQRTITMLEPGQGIVIGLTEDPMTIQFDRQAARHVSVTPTVERVHAQRASQPRPRISQVLAKQVPMRESLFDQALQIFEPGISHHDLAHLLGIDIETAITLFKLLKRLPVSTVGKQGADQHLASERPQIYEIPRPAEKQDAQKEEEKARLIDPADLAKAFALWQAGHASVRKLEAAAKSAGYGWSNGYCRDLIAAMGEHGLIPKREVSVM